MASFSASLKTLGDRRGLPATVTVDKGRLSITAGDQTIGEWALDEIHLEATTSGYRMAAEGEHILIELPDVQGFESELRARARLPRRTRIGKRRERARKPEKPAPAETATAERTSSEHMETGRFVGTMDKAIALAEKRWGSLLPEWVFTRIMLGIAAGVVVITLLLPGLVSLVLLLSGVVLVMIGAIVYTDQVLAAKWLPGRMTPMHVLLYGVGVLMLGVLVGVMA